MDKRWAVREKPLDTEVEKLAKELNIDPVLSALLINRGINLIASANTPIMPSLNDTLALQHRKLLLKLIA